MAFDEQGAQFSLFGSKYDSLMVFLLVYEWIILAILTALWIYLQFFKTSIPVKILRALNTCTLLSIFAMGCILAFYLPDSPPVIYWLMQFIELLLCCLLGLLSLELFKTFSAMGRYFTIRGVAQMQYCYLAYYMLCSGGICASLFNLGRTPSQLIYLVANVNSVVFPRRTHLCRVGHLS